MAVFPDRIVLKNSTDSQAAIEAAIQTGGSDAITQGELVLGIETSHVKFYTKAGDGSIVSLGGTGVGAQNLGDLLDVDLSTPATDGQVIAYNSTSGNWEPVDQSGGGGYTDPLTTNGDIVIRSGGATTRLGVGSEGQVLTVSSGLPVWAAPTASAGLNNVVEDTTPQLGGNLDTNTYYITSASGDVSLAPATGEMVIRGGTSEGKLTLNCTANTHGVSIQSPPHAQAATYTLVLPSSAGTAGQVLTSQGGAQLTWEDAGSGGATSINDLSDVDTNTTPPTQDQVLVWDGTNWVPGDQTGGSGGSGAGIYLTETQTASGGAADFVGLGYSGILQKVTSDLAAWIVLYSSAAERTADAGRAYNTDPTPGSGVLFEAYVTAGGTVVATPGTTYLNNDATLTEAVYAAVRDQAGAAVNANVTFSAYGLAAITAVSGGTFGSGV